MKAKFILIVLLLITNVSLFANTDQTVTLTTTGQGLTVDESRNNALRSAIEQAFGAFISTRTEILDDELVSDQIASVSSGNIQSFDILGETQLSENLWATTVRAVVSVTKLTSFVQARGVQVEIQGGLFAANIRQQILNEEAEEEAVKTMVGILHELLQTSFDYSIEAGNPVATDASNQNWEIPLTITANANDNMKVVAEYFHSTLLALSLSDDEVASYEALNKDVHRIIARSPETTYTLRNERSFYFLKSLISNIEKYYFRLFTIDTGLDVIHGGNIGWNLGSSIIPPHLRTVFDYSRNETRLRFPILGSGMATFTYTDRRTLTEIQQLTGYSVESSGVVSRFGQPEDVYNPTTGKTWMDRNIGALWRAIGSADQVAYGDKFTFNEAQTACPVGYRLPTVSELHAERQSWYNYDPDGAFNSPLKLPAAGYQEGQGNATFKFGTGGLYWSSTVTRSIYAYTLLFGYVASRYGETYQTYKLSVRCIKE